MPVNTIEAAVKNARRFLDVQEEFGSFDGGNFAHKRSRCQHNSWPVG